MLQSRFLRHFTLLLALALPVFLGLTGCGGSSTPVGQVSGKVTFEGKPVREGRVTFQNSETGDAADALLDEEGGYTLKNPLPVGEYQVLVMPLVIRVQPSPREPEVGVEKPAPDIPPKYRTIGTTDLTATVKEGKNELPFDMKR